MSTFLDTTTPKRNDDVPLRNLTYYRSLWSGVTQNLRRRSRFVTAKHRTGHVRVYLMMMMQQKTKHTVIVEKIDIYPK